ncbi:MAG: nitroreductase family protein [Actinomycetota bacterium]|nr:nitroreductase family protein [Actinomycetota bacterium]
METRDALRARRNVRSFADRPIPEAQLVEILEAGRRAPSANNRQHWDFLVSTDRQELEQLATLWQGAGHVASSAATITLVLPAPDDERQAMIDQFDLGQAVMAMAVAAADLGIGSGHAAIADQARCRELLGLPADRYGAYFLALGYPADRPISPVASPKRRPFEEVVHRGRW